jgi:hypothetical protein
MKVTAFQSQQQGKLFAAMQPVLKDLVGEIHRSIGYYKSISRLNRFDKIFLLGNAAKTIHITKFVSQNLQLEATRLASLSRIAVSSAVDQTRLQAYLDTIGPALGLALQLNDLSRMKINLLPAEERARRDAAKRRPVAAVAVALLAVPAYLMYTSTADETKKLKDTARDANGVIEQYKQTESSLKKAKAPIPSYEKELGLLGNIVSERDLPIKILDEINKRIKSTVALPDLEKIWLLSTRTVKESLTPPARAAGAVKTSPWITPDASCVTVSVEGAILKLPQRGNPQVAFTFIRQRLGDPVQKAFNTDNPSVNINPAPITDLIPEGMPKPVGTGGAFGAMPDSSSTQYYRFTATWKVKIGEGARKPPAPPSKKK